MASVFEGFQDLWSRLVIIVMTSEAPNKHQSVENEDWWVIEKNIIQLVI